MNVSEKSIERIEKKMRKYEKDISSIKKDLEILKKKVKKWEINKGTKIISDFEIKRKDQWDVVESNLSKTGILLEYEIFKKLKDMGIDFEQNYSFIYPNKENSFYIDYIFSKNAPITKFKKAPRIKVSENEIDVLIHHKLKYKDGKYIIRIFVYYLIECKSRSNPPINYLFIPNKHFMKFDKGKKSVYRLYGSDFIGDLYVESDYLWSTLRDPIQIDYSNLSVDYKNTLINAFWQLFKCIDYESNFPYTSKLIYATNYDENEISHDREFPRYLQHFNEKYHQFLKDKLIPEKIIKNYTIDLSFYIPIIVVNGNIYLIDMDKSIKRGFIERTKKVPGFIHEFNYLKFKKEKQLEYYHLTRFLMELLKEEGICFKNDSYFPNIFEPVLNIIVTSSDYFPQVLNKIMNDVELKINSIFDSNIEKFFEERAECLRCLEVFEWFLRNSKAFYIDFLEKCFIKYKKFRKERFEKI